MELKYDEKCTKAQLDGKEFSDRVEPQLDQKILFRRVDEKVWILASFGDKLSFRSF